LLAIGLAFLLVFVACGDDPEDTGVPAPSRSPGTGAVPSEPPKGEVNRPKPGLYVYELTGTGADEIPPDTTLTSGITVEGDTVTTKITNNKNSNARTVLQRWESARILHVSSATQLANGDEQGCAPDPAIEILRIPVKVEVYPEQSWEGEGCGEGGSTNIRVTREENVEDAGGRVWSTWKIEEKHSTPRTHLVHFFSPALGVDVRIEDRRALTVTALLSNP
jgi:hypothetical protein